MLIRSPITLRRFVNRWTRGGACAVVLFAISLATDCVFMRTSWRYALFTRRTLRFARISHQRFRGIDLQHCDLTGTDMHGGSWFLVNARGAILRGVDMHQASVRYVNFDHADLGNADLRGVRFVDCRFAATGLRGADMRDAHFDKCRFVGVDLTTAATEGATFGANVCDDRTRWSRSTHWSDPYQMQVVTPSDTGGWRWLMDDTPPSCSPGVR